jgi:hypothetical protein
MNFADGLGREGVMLVEQISIFLENKAGRLAEISRVVAEAGVNIRALSLADTSDFGILRLIVNDNDKAKAALKELLTITIRPRLP